MQKSEELQIRLGVPDEAQAIAKVLSEAFAPFESGYTAQSFAATVISAEAIGKRFDEKGTIWVALKNNEIVGTVSVVPDDERLYLRSMAVSPSAQGGVGRELLKTMINFATENGFEKLFLYTVPFLDRAIKLYEQNGFVRGELETERFFGTSWFEMEKGLGK